MTQSDTSVDMGGVIPGHCFGTFQLPEDLYFVARHGVGATLETTDGKCFIDYVLGSGPLVLGHAHPRVVSAIQSQAARGTTFYSMNDIALRLAERIVELVPCAQAVKFVGDGAEATFYALRLARAFTGRTRVLKFEGAYHGHHDYALHGVNPNLNTDDFSARPDSAGIPSAVSETVLVAPYNDLVATRRMIEPVADTVAAIIVEPVQRALMPKDGFLDGLRKLCDEIGAVLVFDEVVTGFRLALGGAQELFGIRPDLCALGKVVGGGLPLAAVAGRPDIMALTTPRKKGDAEYVYLSGTLNGNAIAAAAGLATIDVLQEENGPARLAEVGNMLAHGLAECADKLSIPVQVIGPPAFSDIVFGEGPVFDYRSHARTNRAAARQFGIELLKRGIFVHPGSKWYVSTAHQEMQIEVTCTAALNAMRTVRDQGYLE